MKILVAAKTRLPRCVGDGFIHEKFSSREGELVMPLFCKEALGVCNRAELYELRGVNTLRTTTCFRIEERLITLTELTTKIYKALQREGIKDWAKPEEAKNIAEMFAKAMIQAASHFPVGDILSKYRSTYFSRRGQHRKARVAIL